MVSFMNVLVIASFGAVVVSFIGALIINAQCLFNSGKGSCRLSTVRLRMQCGSTRT